MPIFLKKSTIYLGLLVFCIVFLVYISSPIMTSSDSRWSIHTSMSILKEGNTDLNEYKQIIEDNSYYAIEEIDGRYYMKFPVGVSLLAVPFVAVADVIFDPLMASVPVLKNEFKEKSTEHGRHVDKLQLIHLYPVVELVIASFFCALAAVIIFLTARVRLSPLSALVVVFIFAFCTSSWSTSSRALWQHGPSMLMLSIALYLLLLENKVNGIIKYVGVPLALAFIIRPTNAIPVFFISTYVFINHRGVVVKYLLIALPLALLFFAYNFSIYNAPFSNYFQPSRVFYASRFIEALLGNIVSPARGVLVYTPVLALSAFGFIRCLSDLKTSSIELFIAIIIVCHWLLISSFPHWWAGHSYGARFFADIIPFFMYFVILFFEDIKVFPPLKKRLVLVVIVPLVVFSFYIHCKGAYSQAVYQWNFIPTNIDADPARLWDWHDLQFAR